MIDVGGPSMLRGAAKNFAHVAPVCRPERYGFVLDELRAQGVALVRDAPRARRRGVRDDRGVRGGDRDVVLRARGVPRDARRRAREGRSTSRTARTRTSAPRTTPSAARARICSRASEQLHGKALSFNNLNDLSAARMLVREFALPACVIVKHANPCGVAIGATLEEAYDKALASDPTSAYGGIVVVNREVDDALGAKLADQFVEVLFAPGYSDAALEALEQKQNTRILVDRERRHDVDSRHYKRVLGGMLVQDSDSDIEDREGWQVVCGSPDERQWGDLVFAWRVCKHVSSNAIVLVKDLADDRHRRGPDEPRRRRQHRGREGDVVRARPRRLRARVRRVLPVPRRAADRARRRHDRDRPAGRLAARPGRDRRGREVRRDDGVHRRGATSATEMTRRRTFGSSPAPSKRRSSRCRGRCRSRSGESDAARRRRSAASAATSSASCRFRGGVFALKELPPRIAEREYRLLGELERRSVPSVEAEGIVSERRSAAGEELESVLITRYLEFSLPYRLILGASALPAPEPAMRAALAELLVRLHLTGFFWGDCSLSNALFRRDAGALSAYLLDAETSELHEQPLRRPAHARPRHRGGEPRGRALRPRRGARPRRRRRPVRRSASDVRRSYEQLWDELTRDEVFKLGEGHKLEDRLRRLNALGFDVEEVELVSEGDDVRLVLQPKVVEPGHHRRRLLRLTGLDAQENQARRLLNDITRYRAWLERTGEKPVSDAAAAGRWLREVFEPTVAAVPPELRGRRAAAELFHELLEHRWFLSEQAGPRRRAEEGDPRLHRDGAAARRRREASALAAANRNNAANSPREEP